MSIRKRFFAARGDAERYLIAFQIAVAMAIDSFCPNKTNLDALLHGGGPDTVWESLKNMPRIVVE